MNVTFSGGTGQQRQWVHDAIASSNFPFDSLSIAVEFTWATPPVANHSAFACTQTSGGGYRITIRPDLDAANRDAVYTGKQFYMETVIHELGHVVQFALADATADHNNFCAMFGAPTSDWSISEATPQGWESAVMEAVAETFKDIALSGRKFDNRTRWRLPSNKLADFVAYFSRPANSETYPGPWS